MPKYTKEEILRNAKEENVRYIRLMFTDINGTIKSVEIPVKRLETALEGKVMFDGSSIEGFVRILEADMYLKPDFNTWLILSWEETSYGKVARLICDCYTPDGNPFPGDPRSNLKRVAARMEKDGFSALNIGFEPDFFLFKSVLLGDRQFLDWSSFGLPNPILCLLLAIAILFDLLQHRDGSETFIQRWQRWAQIVLIVILLLTALLAAFTHQTAPFVYQTF